MDLFDFTRAPDPPQEPVRRIYTVSDLTELVRARLEADPAVTKRVPAAALAACFDLKAALRNVDALFARATPPPGVVAVGARP